MRLPTCAEMAAIDTGAQEEYMIPAAILMENAGRSAAEMLDKDGFMVIIAGKGNNGGDALVIARHLWLKGKRDLHVLFLREEGTELFNLHRSILFRLNIPYSLHSENPGAAEDLFSQAAFLVDGLFGIGLKGPVRDEYRAILGLMNASPARKIALDLPSGLCDDYSEDYAAFHADETLSFGYPKLCQYLPAGRRLCGDIQVVSVGFPPELDCKITSDAALADDSQLETLLPKPLSWDYKNSRGHLAVFAGSTGMAGAATLCSEAALRTGVGLVSLYAESSVYPVLASRAVSVMCRVWDETEDPGQWKAGPFSAALVGPGWGRNRSRLPWLQRLLSAGLPGVIDADGLHLLKLLIDEAETSLNLTGWVLTPHPGEFAALTGFSKKEILENPLPPLHELSRALDCVIVLKGHVSIIASPNGETRIYDGMNPALGTAGSGDVLAGIISGFCARGFSARDAAIAGVLLHGRVGSAALKERGYFLSQDLLPLISHEAFSRER